MRDPADGRREALKGVWADRYPERTTAIVDRPYAPRDRGSAATGPADLEIVTDPLDPALEMALVNPAAEIMDFILRVGPGPGPDRVSGTEWMAEAEVSRTRNRLPDLRRRGCNRSLDRYGPAERGTGITRGHCPTLVRDAGAGQESPGYWAKPGAAHRAVNKRTPGHKPAMHPCRWLPLPASTFRQKRRSLPAR